MSDEFEPSPVAVETETGGLGGVEAPAGSGLGPAIDVLPPSPVFDPGEASAPVQGVPSGVGNASAGGNRSSGGSQGVQDAGLGLSDAGDAGASDASTPSSPAPSTPSSPPPSTHDAGAPPSEAGSSTFASEPDAGTPPPSEPCPSVTFAGSCYEFFAEQLSWGVAEQRCVSWGGHLASVESSEEDGFLGAWPALVGIAFGDGSGLWLGGTDAQTEGDFRWSKGGDLTFVGWASDQPNDGQGIDCIEKRNDATHRWYDRRCTDGERYVCERPQ
jgi:lectin-like protein